ncbi:Hypothetical predicted protein [Octopus vulgaris]|uniref:Uncharacterized protein n=1 Tax=Octopus vulgaris TaxID=6645 RepID=A0AA36B465_OCTVU|nr:Hypothetical predicted protein [Octopus vulgaris]
MEEDGDGGGGGGGGGEKEEEEEEEEGGGGGGEEEEEEDKKEEEEEEEEEEGKEEKEGIVLHGVILDSTCRLLKSRIQIFAMYLAIYIICDILRYITNICDTSHSDIRM